MLRPMANAFLRSRISWPRVGCQMLVVAALLIGARGRALAQSDCSILGQNTFVRDTLFNIYLWYRELPSTDPALFDSPEAYLEAVRFRPLDRSFSFIGSRAETEAFFSKSQFVGFGFGTKQTARRQVRVTQVFAESPASEAGLERGAVLLAIDGRSVSELLKNEEFGSALGPNAIGVRPVGQYGFNFCDKVLFPVSFETRNSLGEGEFFSGLKADCAAADDLNQALGDPEEASLAEALDFLRTGTCSPRAAIASRSLEELRREVRFIERGGWEQTLNAW